MNQKRGTGRQSRVRSWPSRTWVQVSERVDRTQFYRSRSTHHLDQTLGSDPGRTWPRPLFFNWVSKKFVQCHFWKQRSLKLFITSYNRHHHHHHDPHHYSYSHPTTMTKFKVCLELSVCFLYIFFSFYFTNYYSQINYEYLHHNHDRAQDVSRVVGLFLYILLLFTLLITIHRSTTNTHTTITTTTTAIVITPIHTSK